MSSFMQKLEDAHIVTHEMGHGLGRLAGPNSSYVLGGALLLAAAVSGLAAHFNVPGFQPAATMTKDTAPAIEKVAPNQYLVTLAPQQS
jgi:hypothetical protein